MKLDASRFMLASLGVTRMVDIRLLVFFIFWSTFGASDVFVIHKSKGKIQLHHMIGHEDTKGEK